MSDAAVASVLVLHGPNLNLLGTREPEVYGSTTLAQIDDRLRELARVHGAEVEILQSNHEGVLIDRIQAVLTDATDAVLINPGGLTHTSVALRDAIAAVCPPRVVVEVHLSVPEAREPFRHSSLVAGVVSGRVSGFGADSYLIGLEAVLRRLSAHRLGP